MDALTESIGLLIQLVTILVSANIGGTISPQDTVSQVTATQILERATDLLNQKPNLKSRDEPLNKNETTPNKKAKLEDSDHISIAYDNRDYTLAFDDDYLIEVRRKAKRIPKKKYNTSKHKRLNAYPVKQYDGK